MAIEITVRDTETGDVDTRTIDNDVCVITAGSCFIDGIADYPTTGTQVYTIKGRRP